MSVAKSTIKQLSQESLVCIAEIFGNTDSFYNFFYTVIQTEHQLEQNKPDGWQLKSDSAKLYRRLAVKRAIIDCALPDGLIEDIFSDYFEDYANYRSTTTSLSNDSFILILKKLLA